MVSRVQFLVKEERKVLKKIDATKDLALKSSAIKEGKIDQLRMKLEHEKREQDQLRNMYEQRKLEREESQAKKLKKAYEEMLKFETQRKQVRDEKDKIREENNQNKLQNMAHNYQTAEIIRHQNKALKQARYFNDQLK